MGSGHQQPLNLVSEESCETPPPTPTHDFKDLEKREGALHGGTVKKADTWSTPSVTPARTVHNARSS